MYCEDLKHAEESGRSPLDSLDRMLAPNGSSSGSNAWGSFVYMLETARSLDFCFSDTTFDVLTKMVADKSNRRMIRVTIFGVLVALLASPVGDAIFSLLALFAR